MKLRHNSGVIHVLQSNQVLKEALRYKHGINSITVEIVVDSQNQFKPSAKQKLIDCLSPDKADDTHKSRTTELTGTSTSSLRIRLLSTL